MSIEEIRYLIENVETNDVMASVQDLKGALIMVLNKVAEIERRIGQEKFVK